MQCLSLFSAEYLLIEGNINDRLFWALTSKKKIPPILVEYLTCSKCLKRRMNCGKNAYMKEIKANTQSVPMGFQGEFLCYLRTILTKIQGDKLKLLALQQILGLWIWHLSGIFNKSLKSNEGEWRKKWNYYSMTSYSATLVRWTLISFYLTGQGVKMCSQNSKMVSWTWDRLSL